MAAKVIPKRQKTSAEEILKNALPNEFLIAVLDKGLKSKNKG
jgi:hypothetical protein